jgi:hypothetical protein
MIGNHCSEHRFKENINRNKGVIHAVSLREGWAVQIH